jgi:MscS family membrane protein
VPDYATELREREVILLKIMELAEEIDVEFAYPTRTLHIDDAPGWSERKRYPKSTTSEERS